MNLKRIAIGCAQFGNKYGVASSKNISDIEAIKIIKIAQCEGVTFFDTASAYGDSENIIGSSNVKPLNIITKLTAAPNDSKFFDKWVIETVHRSLEKLCVDKIYGLLLHRPSDLLGLNGELLYRTLRQLKNNNIIENIGVSIYSPHELDDIWSKYEIDIIQAPYNCFDQRIVETGWANRICDSGSKLHIRSIFLQGLLLMDSNAYPEYFNPWRNLLCEWRQKCYEADSTPLETCIKFAMNSRAEKIIIGMQSEYEFKDILNSVKNLSNKCLPIPHPCNELGLIDPRQWHIQA